MRSSIRCMGLVLVVTGMAVGESLGAKGELTQALPPHEVHILRDVAREYELTREQTTLLLAIRKVENGGAGLEMGVASDFPNHRSHRYAGNHAKSLKLQARWAAGTIRRHYAGDLTRFAKRYCPPKWAHWRRLIQHWMNRE